MTGLLAQHGAAKGKKITDSILEGILKGAIFSPNDEKIDSIITYVEKTDGLNFENTFLDPQFYFSTFESTVLKKLSDIDSYPSNIVRRDWRKKSPNILNYIEVHAEKTQEISSTLIAPGFYIDNIDWRFDYSIEMYNYCVEKFKFKKYALSLLINTSFFSNKVNVDELIDELDDTVKFKDFIYITFCHDNNAESNYEEMDSSCLGNILYTIYRLKKIGFKIIIGYTFINSILFSVLDCDFVASGWFNTLRKFQKNRFDLSDTFGRRKKRYTSTPLLSYIMFEDLRRMLDTEIINYEDVLSGSKYDDKYQKNPESLSFVDLEHQYWESISIILGRMEKAGDISSRINFMRELIKNAIELYKKVIVLLERNEEKEAATRIKSTSKHLVTWLDAIDVFKSRALIV
ncbi:hypothetical protein HB917_10850 [Listeria seeligeri]|uniref:hypothetical protein n=1 Tax=Listeria seeligeri TaxID=1640 RepID=UPI001624535A|nr:hypothetical protein [Listeria seeligeri]MBC1585696.1 hypothetical protein [Listeria seeligeri]MBC1599762.1 hypothetical protein [Listeria seeligeri]